MLKLLIADGTEEFRLALADSVRDTYLVRTCSSGTEALDLLHSFCPDILVLDMLLPGLDGISLLHDATASGLNPMVLATTRYINDYILESVEKLGVGYLMNKPCDIKATASRIADLSQRIHPSTVKAPDPRVHISNLLLSLGIPAKLNGYGYLREGILLFAADPKQSITKELYPAISRLCGSEPLHVERSIRSAVHSAWKRRDDRVWKQYFQPDADGSVPRPSNAAFIAQLADHLNLLKENPR